MQKILTGLAAAAALGLFASAAQADCMGHNVTASSEKSQEKVAMSTYDGATTPVVVEKAEVSQEASAAPVCAAGDKDCAPGTKEAR